jgi:hypothetical protein
MKNNLTLTAGLITLFIISGSVPAKKSPFSVKENTEGVELSESGKPVFFYQRKPKSLTGQYVCNNYLHPVYNLAGEIITEEFPADHPYHRGIFWAWHQLYAGNQSLGDGWIMEKISQDVVDVKTTMSNKTAQFDINALWKSSSYKNGSPFIDEHTSIIVHSKESNIRKIDFKIVLKPLVQGVQIGGSDDEKGYGGFCVRVKLPPSLIFTSEKGSITPQNLQIKSGPWMDFSAIFGKGTEKSGLTILCHPTTPNYPAPWILRQQTSMQNIVFPGRERIKLDKTVILRYRVIIHDGDAQSLNIPVLQAEYGKMYDRK